MSMSHALMLIDHHCAQLLRLDVSPLQAVKVQEHSHPTRQHGRAVRTEHGFFAEVGNSLKGIQEDLVTRSHGAQPDYGNGVHKHRQLVNQHTVGWRKVDHPTEGQLVALARAFLVRHDCMSGNHPAG